ncbi:peroxiredoxin-like family protein [Methyloceanibacter sp.]|uniref:peroxiredoxin-like family protein n=1 Tax=Methyloceanibacter sp. TaxID=1965321 RepID=UPI002D5B552B|nr:peroxiredoxin-like family protein [Methyloceanibacter sp.]HZP10434.1 peroxiredoxin-like family protein [Methyloceanibacter sp.]
MNELPAFATLDEAFLYCRDMDASLNERLEAFSAATRYLIPGYQEAVDRMVNRLKAFDAGEAAPKPGERMPPFAMPDEEGRLVTLDELLSEGPLAMTFNRGHWCPYCRINTRALAEVEHRVSADGAHLAAIMPDRQRFAAAFKAEGEVHYPVLTDIDNGYALSLNLAVWVGEEMQRILESGGRNLPEYQGNQAWVLPIPATFVISRAGVITARFIDPDYRNRMTIEELLAALKAAFSTGNQG